MTRIKDMLKSHHFHSGEEREITLYRYVWLYNQELPQSVLGRKTPLQSMKDRYIVKLELFQKKPHSLPGRNGYGGVTLNQHAQAEKLNAFFTAFGKVAVPEEH